MWLLFLFACKEPDCGIGERWDDEEEACVHLSYEPPGVQAWACQGANLEVSDASLRQLCIECGDALCQFHVVSATPLSRVEMELAGEALGDPDWREFHDAFTLVDGLSGEHWRLVLPVVYNPALVDVNVATVYTLADPDIRAAITAQFSLVRSDGAYGDCAVWGADPGLFSAGCPSYPLE